MSPVINFDINNTKDAYITASMENISGNSTSVDELFKNSNVQKVSFISPPSRGLRPATGQVYPR
jgi:hypothetical protein